MSGKYIREFVLFIVNSACDQSGTMLYSPFVGNKINTVEYNPTNDVIVNANDKMPIPILIEFRIILRVFTKILHSHFLSINLFYVKNESLQYSDNGMRNF